MSESELNFSCDSDSDVMDSVRKRQLLNQIAELQYAVTDMKSAFTAAVQQLSRVQVDEVQGGLAEKVEQDKAECQNQVSEVLKLMLSMRAEFASLKHQVNSSCEAQQNLQRQVQTLVWERDLLVEELCKSGSISDQIRYRIQNPRQLGRASSGSHSNDSGVVLVVDKGANPSSFDNNVVGSFLTSGEHRDAGSIPYQPPNLISPLVHDYVAGLEQDRNDFIGDENSAHAYDSDSSLVNAANKSISLSTSLGKQCGLELDSCDVGSGDDDDDVDDEDNHIDNEPDSNRVLESCDPDVDLCDAQPIVVVAAAAMDVDNVENTRRLVLSEIVDTERRYCKSLSTLHDTFAVPLKRSGILSSKDVNTLFPDEVFQLYGKHCVLLHNLEERLRCWGRHKTIGDVFNNFTDPDESNVLQLYTSYVDDFPEVLKTFHKLCRQSTKFARFLKSRLSQPACGGLDLGVFLVTPVQRIPHYVLLLKRMLRLTNEKHPDHEWLSDCLERLKDFMDRLNDTMEHSFQLITAQIQPEDEQKQRPQRNAKTRSRQDLCANSSSSQDEQQTNFNLPPKRTSSKELLLNTKESASASTVQDNCQRHNQQQQQQQQHQQQEKHFRRLSQSNVRSLLPCGNNKLRTRSRSESLVSSISSTNSEDQDGGDWNVHHQRHHHHVPHQQQQQQQQRFSRKSEPYYWHDDVEFQCESGSNSISTEEDSNNAGGASILLRHISEDSDSDDDDGRASGKNVRSSKSMLDVTKRDDQCASEPNLVDANGILTHGQHLAKCCQHSSAIVGRGVSLACISPTDKRIRAKLMMQQPGGRRPLDKSQSAHNLVKSAGVCEDCSLDSSSSNSGSASSSKLSKNDQSSIVKKRNFIRTSLKNILLFKKRNNLKRSATAEVVSQQPCPPRTIVEEEKSAPAASLPNDGCIVLESDFQQGCCCSRPSNRHGQCKNAASSSCHCQCGKVHTCSSSSTV